MKPEAKAEVQPEVKGESAPPQPAPQPQERPVQNEQSFAGKTGSLSLSSVPVRAEIIIDGQSKGKTPLTLNGLALGKRYELALKAPGFETLTKFFTLRRENNNLVLNLTPSQSSGKSFISIEAQPPSQVFIDGKLVANFESVYMFEVSPGAHTLRFINKKLDIDYSTSVNVSKGEHFKKNITLR